MDTESDRITRKIQKCELLIAQELKRICEKYNIKFFLLCGSMLGAVRHKGFIPWDDDMDFGMLWDDYKKFIDVCYLELDKKFTLQNWDNDTKYPFSYSKIILNGTLIKEKFAPKDKESGIFVDIFPLYCMPSDVRERKKQRWKVFLYRRILWMKQGYGEVIKRQNLKQWIKYNVTYFLSFFWRYEQTKKKLKKILINYDDEKSDFLYVDTDYTYEKNTIKREWIKELVQYEFDGVFFPGMKEYDAYLKHLYGNYMTLPKDEDRVNHEITMVEFGNYK